MRSRIDVDRQRLVALTWVYFVLLVIEGALRKWALPWLSDPLLIVRDPIALAMLAIAIRSGLFRADALVRSLAWLCVPFVALGALQLASGAVASPLVIAFGLRTYFLHLPVIFIIGEVLAPRDLRRLMIAILLLAIPIAALMVEQFRAAPTEWINRGVGEGRLQIQSALGRIRPAGPFSFITGPALYFTLVLACLLVCSTRSVRLPLPVRWAGWAALFLAGVVSGSRGLVANLIPVLVAALAGSTLRPRRATGFFRAALMAGVVLALIWDTEVTREGLAVFAARLDEAPVDGLMARWVDSYAAAMTTWTHAPLAGHGIGRGTNVAGALLGTGVFGLGESEWVRVLNEAGPVLGVAYLAWRVSLALHLVTVAVSAMATNGLLPLLLCGASVVNLVEGQWSQPTTQGFAVFTAGLSLAAARSTGASRERPSIPPAGWHSRVAIHDDAPQSVS